MSEIALYNALTKADIVKLEKFIAEREARMTWKMVAVGLAVVGLIKYLVENQRRACQVNRCGATSVYS